MIDPRIIVDVEGLRSAGDITLDADAIVAITGALGRRCALTDTEVAERVLDAVVRYMAGRACEKLMGEYGTTALRRTRWKRITKIMAALRKEIDGAKPNIFQLAVGIETGDAADAKAPFRLLEAMDGMDRLAAAVARGETVDARIKATNGDADAGGCCFIHSMAMIYRDARGELPAFSNDTNKSRDRLKSPFFEFVEKTILAVRAPAMTRNAIYGKWFKIKGDLPDKPYIIPAAEIENHSIFERTGDIGIGAATNNEVATDEASRTTRRNNRGQGRCRR